jgi:hypothetical protein
LTKHIQLVDQNTRVPPSTNLANHIAIVDTGATGHYLDTAAEPHCTGIRATTTGPSLQVANGDTITTTKRAVVLLSTELSNKATAGHIFEHLKSGSLISIGQLCNDDCVALDTKYEVKIYKNGHIIIVGKRNATNGLFTIPLAPKPALPPPPAIPTPGAPSRHTANGVI